MTESASNATDAGLILWMAEQKAQAGEWVEPAEVAEMISARRGKPLPDWLLTLACAHLRGGGAKRPQGRQPTEKSDRRSRHLEIARSDYDELRTALKRRAQRPENAKRKCKLYHPLHEVALALVLKRNKRREDFMDIDLKRFRALISSF